MSIKYREYISKDTIQEIIEKEVTITHDMLPDTVATKEYVGEEIANLINGAPTTLDTLGEIATAMSENADVVEALEGAIGNKANSADLTSHTSNKSNPHGVTLSQLGVTATASELNFVGGVTSNIQTQLNAKVPTSRTVNGKALSSNISLTASDVGALPNTTQIPSISGLATETFVNNKVSGLASTSYVDTKFNGVSHPVSSVNGRTGAVQLTRYDMLFIGDQPVTSTSDDTTAKWASLGPGYAWYYTAGLLNGQPSGYGFVVSYVQGSDVFQIWNCQNSGPMYYRSGNASGWAGTWKKFFTSENITISSNNPSGGSDGDFWIKI